MSGLGVPSGLGCSGLELCDQILGGCEEGAGGGVEKLEWPVGGGVWNPPLPASWSSLNMFGCFLKQKRVSVLNFVNGFFLLSI